MHTREENSKKRKHTFWDDLPELVKLDKEDMIFSRFQYVF